MLLLMLFAGCFASCAAQPDLRMTEDLTERRVGLAPAPTLEFVAAMEVTVRTILEINSVTDNPFLNELYLMINSLGLSSNFTLTVKKITRVSVAEP